jgi:hypothetical protein
MTGLLLAAGMIGVMSLGLVVLARQWPRSSRRTGYRISGQNGGPPGEEPPVPEDDDTKWNWKR